MSGMILHAKLALDDLSDSGGRPYIPSKSKGLGSLVEQLR